MQYTFECMGEKGAVIRNNKYKIIELFFYVLIVIAGVVLLIICQLDKQ